jgi:APA family basic amino acid/polyamine antiporter
LHPRYRTPWIGIIVFAVAAIVITLPGQAEFLGYLYAFGAMLSFTIAHVALIRLRVSRPDIPRTYRPPGNVVWRGKDIPLFAVVGGLGTAAAFFVTVFLHPAVAAVGVGWLVLGVIVYLLYRRAQGLDLTSTHKVAIPQPVVDHEAEYDSVLVPLADGHYDESVIATAAKLAARRRRGIHVIALVTVPSALKIDAPMPEAEAAAASLIEQARVQGGARVSGHVERVRSGQAGRRIIEEAADMRAAAIVMPLPRRIGGASLFGKTLETVLAERPCRVIIESQPDGRPQRILV